MHRNEYAHLAFQTGIPLHKQTASPSAMPGSVRNGLGRPGTDIDGIPVTDCRWVAAVSFCTRICSLVSLIKVRFLLLLPLLLRTNPVVYTSKAGRRTLCVQPLYLNVMTVEPSLLRLTSSGTFGRPCLPLKSHFIIS